MPPKSNARNKGQSSPSISNQNPSGILRAWSTSLPQNTFIKLLEEGLYPALNALPATHKNAISKALTEVKSRSDEALQKLKTIAYDEHKKSLNDGIKALNKSVKKDWKNGWEEQGEMIQEIVEEVLEWLPVLWSIAVGDGLELPLVQRCLLLCSETANKVADCHSRAEFDDMDFEVTIINSEDATIYEETSAHINHTLAWMWREILVAAASQGKPTKGIVSDIERLKIKDKVYSLIRKNGEDTHYTGYDFWDTHWTTAMKEAASRLLVSKHTALIASFHKAPSFDLYTKLMKEAPDLKTTLLEATRTAVFPSSPSAYPTITYCAAANIFSSSSQTDDLVRLLDALPKYSSDNTVGRAERTIIRYLGKQSDTTRHKAALDAIARGLKSARQNALEVVHQAFPSLEEAYCWLERQIDSQKLTHKAPWGDKAHRALTSPEWELDVQRSNCLYDFVHRADRGSYEYGYGSDTYGFNDSDGDDSDEEHKNVPDSVNGAIWGWFSVLQEWPDKKAAAKVWDEVKQTDADSLLFTVDGLAEALASQCDWEYDHSYARQHVADVLRDLHKVFSRSDL